MGRGQSWSRSESPVSPGNGIGAGVGKNLSDSDSGPESQDTNHQTDNDFGRTVMHHPENIERQEEKENGSVKIKSETHLVLEFCLIKGTYQK